MGCNLSIHPRILPKEDGHQEQKEEHEENDDGHYEPLPVIVGNDSLTDQQFITTNSLQQASGTTTGIAAFPSFFNPDAKPTIFEYKFIRHIGHGAASDVFLVYNTENSQEYAAKIYDKNFLYRTSIGDAEQPIQKVIREIQIMSSIDHENCLKLVEILDDECTNSLVLILPFADAGSLSPYSWKADPLPEEEARQTFFQLALGLQHLHLHNIIHRDLKPDNILKFMSGVVVISDFSVSIMLSDPDQPLEDTDGTPAFYSPEECGGELYLGKPADVWSFGITMYVMVYGRLPFFEADDEGVFYSQFFKISQCIMNDQIKYPENIPISPQLRDLFNHLLDKNSVTRYTIDQALEHPWFAGLA